MIKEIIQQDNPLLRKVSEHIDFSKLEADILNELKTDLLDTLKAQPTGVAISAVQIGELKRMFVIFLKGKDESEKDYLEYFINPTVVYFGESIVEMFEGCLSIDHANLFGKVKRPSKIRVAYKSGIGEDVEKTFDGFKARVIQHELDHLDGILFTDKVEEGTVVNETEYRNIQKTAR